MPSDWKEIEGDSKEKYALYLCSREWAEKRRAVIDRAETNACSELCCERCLSHQIEVVHHLSYERKYDESLDDLQGLCRACHDYTHAKSDFDPKNYRAIQESVRQQIRNFIQGHKKSATHGAVGLEWRYADYQLDSMFPSLDPEWSEE